MRGSEREPEKVMRPGVDEAVPQAEIFRVAAAKRPDSPKRMSVSYAVRSKFFAVLAALTALACTLYMFFLFASLFEAKSPEKVVIDLSDSNVLAQLCKETKDTSGVTVDGEDICLKRNDMVDTAPKKNTPQKQIIKPQIFSEEVQENNQIVEVGGELDLMLSSKDVSVYRGMESVLKRNIEIDFTDLYVDDKVTFEKIRNDLTIAGLNSRVEMPEDSVYKCRSIQIEARLGVFIYPHFKCKITSGSGGVKTFQKISGSQRKNGILKKLSSGEVIFIGAWSVNDDPVVVYNKDEASSEKNQVGKLLKKGEFWYLVFNEGYGRSEIYQISK
jgi:hypothetical protein